MFPGISTYKVTDSIIWHFFGYFLVVTVLLKCDIMISSVFQECQNNGSNSVNWYELITWHMICNFVSIRYAVIAFCRLDSFLFSFNAILHALDTSSNDEGWILFCYDEGYFQAHTTEHLLSRETIIFSAAKCYSVAVVYLVTLLAAMWMHLITYHQQIFKNHIYAHIFISTGLGLSWVLLVSVSTDLILITSLYFIRILSVKFKIIAVKYRNGSRQLIKRLPANTDKIVCFDGHAPNNESSGCAETADVHGNEMNERS